MNKGVRSLAIAAMLVLGLWFAPGSHAQGKKSASGEEFFIIASLDQSRSQLLLKHPTEVTMLAKVTEKTAYVDETGKALSFGNLRAGDTVWVTTSGTGDNLVATRVRKGPMTVEDLHKYYLDYPEIK